MSGHSIAERTALPRFVDQHDAAHLPRQAYPLDRRGAAPGRRPRLRRARPPCLHHRRFRPAGMRRLERISDACDRALVTVRIDDCDFFREPVPRSMPRKLMRGQCGRLRREEARVECGSRQHCPPHAAIMREQPPSWPRTEMANRINPARGGAAPLSTARAAGTRHRFTYAPRPARGASAHAAPPHGLTADETALRRDRSVQAIPIRDRNARNTPAVLLRLFVPDTFESIPNTQTVEQR